MQTILHVGNLEFVARAEKITSPSLHIQKQNGEIYHVALMPVGGNISNATETLIYEQKSINTCEQVNLSAGIYRAEIRGGTGGKPYRCASGTGLTRNYSNIVSEIFKLNQDTTIYSFRGGDGNDSGAISTYQITGGGASGTDSILIAGTQIIIAHGGTGSHCMMVSGSAPGGGGWSANMCAGGGGGNYFEDTVNNGSNSNKTQGNNLRCAPGGGGANASTGGATGTIYPTSHSVNVTQGTSANSVGGGNGGNAHNLNENSETLNIATGGTGGKNTYYSCGGQTAVSYGGGGGGAICLLRQENTCTTIGAWCRTDCFNGGDGGTGSTNTSNDSFVKIYRIG